MPEKNEAAVRTPPTTAAPVTFAEQNVAIKADPKEVRREVIQKLREYKRRLDARQELQERYEALCTQLYSGRSSRITGMPVNHDQVAAQDRFIAMIDEKMELERALSIQTSEGQAMEVILRSLNEKARIAITGFYLSPRPYKALNTLQLMLNMSTTAVYRLRDNALDDLAEMLCNNRILV